MSKLNRLATITRLDIAIFALDLAKKRKKAMLKDLRYVNRVLKKVHKKEIRVLFKRIGEKDDLCVIGVCDASYHTDDNSVGGEIIMLGSKKTNYVSPIFANLAR